jgi:hypothetical protein
MEHLFLHWVPMFGNCLYFGLMQDEDLMGKLKCPAQKQKDFCAPKKI